MRATDRKDQQPPGFQKSAHPGKVRLRVGQMFQKMRREHDVLTALWQVQSRHVADNHPGAPRPQPSLGGPQHRGRPIHQGQRHPRPNQVGQRL